MHKPRPIRPEDVGEHQAAELPDSVIVVVNQLIALQYCNGEAVLLQETIVRQLMKVEQVSTSYIFENGWLNFEEAYRAAGWDVEYDKPGYNESYPPRFIFRVIGLRNQDGGR